MVPAVYVTPLQGIPNQERGVSRSERAAETGTLRGWIRCEMDHYGGRRGTGIGKRETIESDPQAGLD